MQYSKILLIYPHRPASCLCFGLKFIPSFFVLHRSRCQCWSSCSSNARRTWTNIPCRQKVLTTHVFLIMKRIKEIVHVFNCLHYFLMFGSVTSSCARIETSIPRKHGPAIAGYESVCSCTVSLYTCIKLWLIEFLWYYPFICFSVGFEEILLRMFCRFSLALRISCFIF